MDSSIQDDDIVISGVGGRFPECNNLEELKNVLFDHTEVITNNDTRWKPGKFGMPSNTGKVHGMDQFDTAFFGIHRKLSDATDPLARILLEDVFEACLDAGMNPSEIKGARCGVYMGSSVSESENIFITISAENGFGIMGHNRSMLANRVSYWLDLKGPSFAFDSSFCSGFKGLEMAKTAIKNGECDMAIIGTAVLSFHAEVSVHYSDCEYLTEESFSRPFDEKAQGYPRSESVIVMMLQKRSAAKRVYASLCDVDCCFFGKDQPGPMLNLVPCSMENFLRDFYEKSNIDPNDLAYLETEGTGVKWIDELEIEAIDKAICSKRKKPLPIGTAKSLIGHCEAAAGLVGICKVIIAMEQGVIPATLHHEKPNPNLRGIVEGRMNVVTENAPWEGGLVAINAMGVGNMFSHCVIRSFPKAKKAPPPITSESVPRLICLSARHEEGMKSIIEQVDSRPVDHEYVRLLHDVFSAHIFGHLYRGYTFMPEVPSQSEMVPYSGGKQPVWYVYSGMGSQWAGMGRDLMKIKVFADAVERCHKVLLPHGVDLKHIITTEDESVFDNILNSFVGIAAVQIGLTDILRALGIKPDGIIGHSVGELGCAYADGCFTAEQMILAAHARGRASIETDLIRGTMAAVGLGYKKIKNELPEPIEVACHNSSTSCTISGPDEDMIKYVAELKRKNVFARAVNVSNIAYHSRYIAPAGPKLLSLLKEVIPHPVERSDLWVSTSVPEDQWDTPLAKTSSPEYHTNNLLSPVLFEEGSSKIPQNAIILEIAPHGLLQAILRRSLGERCVNIPLTKRASEDGAIFLLKSIGKMYLAGMQPQIQNIYDPIEYPVSRGTPGVASLVTWDHSDVWYTGRAAQAKNTIPAEDHFNVTLREIDFRPYNHYKWKGHSIFTPANCLELVSKKIKDTRNDNEDTIIFEDLQFPNVVDIPSDEPISVYVLYQRGSGRFEVSSDLVLLATGRAYIPDDPKQKIRSELAPLEETDPICIFGQEQVYSALLRRGLSVADDLAGINEIKIYEKDWIGSVAHNGDKKVLLDILLQICLLKASDEFQELHRPLHIKRITFILEPCPSTSHMPVRYNVASGVIQAGCIEVVGVKTDVFSLKPLFEPLLLHAVQFKSHPNPAITSPRQLIALVVQLVRVHQSRLFASLDDTQLGILVLKSPNFNALQEDVNTVSSRLTNINITTKPAIITPDLLQEANKATLLVAGGTSINVALSLFRNTFLLIRTPVGSQGEPAGGWDRSIGRIIDITIGNERYQLLKRVSSTDGVKGEVLAVKECDDISKLNLSTRGTTYLVWDKLPESGLDSILAKVRIAAGGHRTSCVFLLDENVPPFEPTSPFFSERMTHGLWVNVYLNGTWGEFYTLPMLNEVFGAEVDKDTVPFNALSGLNPQDILCLGLNPLDLAPCGQRAQPRDVGPTDFVVVDPSFVSIRNPRKRPRRFMGLAAPSESRSTLNAVPELTWLIPDDWSSEDAATVPFAYSVAYHVVIDIAELKEGEIALVHDGASSIGQAAIRVIFSVKGKVITSVSCEEERQLIKELFPQIPNDHIIDINDLECELRIKYLTKGKGLMCAISNVRGDALEATFRCTDIFGSHIQLGTEDARHSRKMGTYAFLRSTQFVSRNSTFITAGSVALKRRTKDMVERGLNTGVVQPIKKIVFNANQVEEALTEMNRTRKKVVIYLRPDYPVPKLRGTPPESEPAEKETQNENASCFKCNPDASYLIIGGRDGFAIDILEWLLKRGARFITMARSAGVKDWNNVYESARRFEFLEKYYSANITVANTDERPDNQARAKALLQGARAVKPLGTIFILPMDEPAYGLTLQHVDAVCRTPEFAQTAYIVLRRGGHSQRAIAICERRRRSGLPGGLIDVGTTNTYVSLLPLDRLIPLASSASTNPALSAEEGVGSHSVLRVMQQSGCHDEQRRVLGEFLPRTLEAAVALGRALSPNTYHQAITTKSRNVLREIPPIFIITGLTDGPREESKTIAENIIVPAVLLHLPASIKSIQHAAECLVKDVLACQPKGPYSILGIGWAGAVALELGIALEALVPKERWDKNSNAVYVVDGAPNTVRDTLPLQVHTRAFEAKLLCQLLHLDMQVFDHLEGLPSWDERMQAALALLPPGALAEMDKPFIEAAYRAILQRLQALRSYEGPSEGRRLRGEVMLIRPAGMDHNYRCGLEVYSENAPLVYGPSRAVANDYAKTWKEAGSKICEGLRVGTRKMSTMRLSYSYHSQLVWQKLR